MKSNIIICLIVIFIVSSLNVNAEKLDFDQFFSLVVNYMGEDEEAETLNVEDLQETLLNAYENPLNWNEITRQQLEELQFINEHNIEEILFYADYYGPVHSISELRLVENIDAPMLLLLPSVICVKEVLDSVKWNDAFDYTSHKFVVRSDYTPEKKKGFYTDTYKGPNFRLLSRYQFVAGENFKAGVSMESDPGEPWKFYNSEGFDLYRAYIEFSNLPYVNRITMGSYHTAFGKGLIFGQQSYGSKLMRILNSEESYYGIKSYGGTSESPILNGVALSANYCNLQFTILYGHSSLDADTSNGVWHSYSADGYHRSIAEIDKKNTLHLNTIGANILYRRRFWHLGSTAYGGFFTLPAVKSNGKWNTYDFEGNKQWGVSLNYGVCRKGISFSGETAVCQNNGVATTNTLKICLMSELIFSLNYRYFSNKYHSFWSNASSSSRVNGEHGASFAMSIPVGRSKHINILADVYKLLWLSVYNSNTSVAYELGGEFTGYLKNNLHIFAFLRYKNHPVWNSKTNDKLLVGGVEQRGQMHLKLLYGNKSMNFTSGLQFNISHKNDFSLGWQMYQDVAYKVSVVPLRFKLRLTLYNAPSWSNRFYLYESDVPGSGFSPAMYGSAFRWYFMTEYNAKFGLNVSFRISQTLFTDRDFIGSGWDRIESKHKTDFHLYFSYRLKSHKKRIHYE